MSVPTAVIFGCGYTGVRVAERLLLRGLRVIALGRNPDGLRRLQQLGATVYPWSLAEPVLLPELSDGVLALHSLPDISEAEIQIFQDYLLRINPLKITYISTTGVYGNQSNVDISTVVAPADDKNQRRVAQERFVLGGSWKGLVLRPAAIYGPHRGVHTHIQAGREPRARGGVVSRIHVWDLAAQLELGMLTDLCGAFPVADERPCSSQEIAQFCRRLFEIGEPAEPLPAFEIAGRRVDGSGIREILEISLGFPDYQSGILASIAVETAGITGPQSLQA